MALKHSPVDPRRLSMVIGAVCIIEAVAHFGMSGEDGGNHSNILAGLWVFCGVVAFLSAAQANMVRSSFIDPWRLYLVMAAVGAMGAIGTFEGMFFQGTSPSPQTTSAGLLWLIISAVGILFFYRTRKSEPPAEDVQAA